MFMVKEQFSSLTQEVPGQISWLWRGDGGDRPWVLSGKNGFEVWEIVAEFSL